jgi:integrase
MATAHAFRTLFSTRANEAGWNRDAIEKQLAHEERDDVRGAYNRALWLEELSKMMQWWANYLDKLRVDGSTPPRRRGSSAANVVS